MSQPLRVEPQEQEAARDEGVEKFRQTLPRICLALIALVLSLYLLEPWFQDQEISLQQEGGTGEDYPLDCFLFHDASGSADSQDYGRVEQAILNHLSMDYGDRVSFSVFGSDVLGGVQALSDDKASVEDQRRVALASARQIAGTTDFARLFDRIRDAIREDRLSQVAAKRDAHADAVIIISDGVPDLTIDDQSCPLQNEELISDEIVASYDAMVNSLYATQEPIYVRLVLVGSPPRCAPKIREEWEKRLGSQGLEVLSYPANGNLDGLGVKLLKPLRHHSRIILRLKPLKDQERQKLDRGKKFSAQFSARSFIQGGSIRIESAALVDARKRQLRLHALRNSEISATDPRHHPEILVPSPPADRGLGDLVDDEEFYLQPDPESAQFSPLESEAYQLIVKATVLEQPQPGHPVPSVEVEPLDIRPCNKAEQKSKIRERLKLPAVLSLALGGFFATGALAWFGTYGAASRSRTRRLNALLEAFFVRPYKRWIWIFLILLIPATLGVLGLQKAGPALICVLLIFGSLFGLREKLGSSPMSHVAFRLIEFIALPLVTEVAANYLT